MFADGCLSQKFSDGLSSGRLDGTNQQAVLAQVKHVQGTAALQPFPFTPLQRKHRLAFAGQGHRHRFYHGKDLLPEKPHLSRVWPGFHLYNIVPLIYQTGKISCQTLQMTMKNMNRNMVGGGWTVKAKFRQCEIRGQRRQRGRFPSNHFFAVRIYYHKNAIYQGFRRNWPVEICANLAPSRRKFLPNLSIDDE